MRPTQLLVALLVITAIAYSTVHTINLKLPFGTQECLVVFLAFLIGLQAILYFQPLRKQVGAGTLDQHRLNPNFKNGLAIRRIHPRLPYL